MVTQNIVGEGFVVSFFLLDIYERIARADQTHIAGIIPVTFGTRSLENVVSKLTQICQTNPVTNFIASL